MAIRVIKEPDIVVTEEELRSYRKEFIEFCRYHVNPCSLEEYIRRAKAKKAKESKVL